MTLDAVRDGLSTAESAGWDAIVLELDRIAPGAFDVPGAGPDDWTAKDVLFHLAEWADEAARQVRAVREGTYVEPHIDTDQRNEEILRQGRAFAPDEVRLRAERARSRLLAQWAAIRRPSAPAVEWFGASGAEHYAEHIRSLRAFADALEADGRPGAPDRRRALVAAEAETWNELEAAIDAFTSEDLERPGVTPDGWSVKDTMWHLARWWEDFVGATARFSDPSFDPDTSADEIDATNRAWFEESRPLGPDVVRSAWREARDAGVAAFVATVDPSRTAERWFEECGTIHAEKHLIDLRAWAAVLGSARGSQ